MNCLPKIMLDDAVAAFRLLSHQTEGPWLVRLADGRCLEAVFLLPWAVIFRRLPAITGSAMFGFWEMLVYLGFVAVGLFYVWKKGILNWSYDKGDL